MVPSSLFVLFVSFGSGFGQKEVLHFHYAGNRSVKRKFEIFREEKWGDLRRVDSGQIEEAETSQTSLSANQPTRYTIDIPAFWSKEDLLDLRDYLEKSEVGLTPVWIRIHGLEKDTKFSIASISGLEEWLGKKGI